MKLLNSQFSIPNCRRAFTLVEVVIYIAIFSSMILFIAAIVWRIGDSVTANRGRTSLETEADFAFSKIRWAASGVSTIDQPAVSATSTTLQLTRYNFSGNPLLFQVINGTLFMSRASSTAIALTSQNTRVVSFLATHSPSVVSTPESVQVILVLSASSSESNVLASTTLQSTFYLRK